MGKGGQPRGELRKDYGYDIQKANIEFFRSFSGNKGLGVLGW